MSEFDTLFKSLAEHTQVVYFSYSVTEGHCTYVSPAYQRLALSTASSPEQDLPQWLTRLHPDDHEYLQEQWHLLLGGQPVEEIELRVRHPDGRRQWFSLTACPGTNAQGQQMLFGTLNDITQQRAAAENANKFNIKKNATLEILAHDLSGPLMMMQQLAEHVAEHSRAYQDPALDNLVRLMHKTCQESVALIHDFVDNEFLESAQVRLTLERLNLVERLRLLVGSYVGQEAMLGKQFGFHPASDPIYAYVDDNKLHQVFNNLISNALKFTPDGGRIDISVAELPGRVLITVADTGIGIPEKLQPVLFEKFTPARRPGLRGEKSTGLGMSVIRTIVGLHQGRIWFESQEGQGTTFYVELPQHASGGEEE